MRNYLFIQCLVSYCWLITFLLPSCSTPLITPSSSSNSHLNPLQENMPDIKASENLVPDSGVFKQASQLKKREASKPVVQEQSNYYLTPPPSPGIPKSPLYNNNKIQQPDFDSPEKLSANSKEEKIKMPIAKIENDWEKLEINYDDSSDEEDTNTKVSAFNLAKEIKKFDLSLIPNDSTLQTDNLLNSLNLKQHHLLSLICHAIGIEVLYDRQVAKKYYPLKKKLLKQELRTAEFKTYLEGFIKNFIPKIIYQAFINELYKNSIPHYHHAIWVLIKDFIRKNESCIQALNDLLFQESISITQYKDAEQIDPSLDVPFQNLQTALIAYMNFLGQNNYAALQQLLQQENYIFPKPKKLPTQFADLKEYPILQQGLQEKAIEKNIIKGLLNKHQCVSPQGKILTNKKLKNDLPAIIGQSNNKLEKYVLQEVKNLGANTSINKFIRDISEKYSKVEMAFDWFQEAIQAEKKRQSSIIDKDIICSPADIPNSALKEYEDMLHECIPLTLPRLSQVIYQNIKDMPDNLEEPIQIRLEELINWLEKQERKILPNWYTFDFQKEYSIPGFLANLRLCNRSAKRLIKNNQYFPDKLLLGKQKLSRGCLFPASEYSALEIQEITNQGNRRDLVINSGSYQDMFRKIEEIKETIRQNSIHPVSDPEIADWIRKIWQGDSLTKLTNIQGENLTGLKAFQLKEIKRVLVDLTYLLFGTEVVRNPASLLHHNMMLDLLSNGSYTWHSFLITDKDQLPMLPMEIEGSVKCARALHTKYNNYMPYSYSYPKGETSIEDTKVIDLITREAYLTRIWAEKYAKVAIKPENNPEAYLNSIIDAIYQAWPRWFEFKKIKTSIIKIKKSAPQEF